MRLIMQSVATSDPRPPSHGHKQSQSQDEDRRPQLGYISKPACPARNLFSRPETTAATTAATGQASATASSTRDRVLCHSTSTQGALSHEPSPSRCGGTTSQLDTAQRCAHPGTAAAPDTQRTAAHRGGSGAALSRTVSFIREWEGNSRKLLPDYQAC